MIPSRDNPGDDQLRILVVQTAYLGDIILTTPLISALKQIFPFSHLAFLTTPIGKEALQGLEEIDEIMLYDKRGKEKGFKNLRKKIREIKEKNFNLAISPHRSFRTSFLLALSKIPVLVGFEEASLSFVYHFRLPRKKELHEVERNLELIKPIGELPEDFQPRIKLPGLRDFSLDKFGIKKDSLLVGIAPGSAWAGKRWLSEYYAQLSDLLSRELGAKVVLIGNDSDQKLGEEIESLAQNSLINLAGKTSIKELFGIISQLDLLVSNDSAPVHIASGYSVPVVVIYGPTVPAFGFTPYQTPHKIIEKALECRPCHHHGPRACPEGHFRCMKEISPQEVFEAVVGLLKETHQLQ